MPGDSNWDVLQDHLTQFGYLAPDQRRAITRDEDITPQLSNAITLAQAIARASGAAGAAQGR